MAATGRTTWCPLPASWYPAGDPCTQSAPGFTASVGAAQQPWVSVPATTGDGGACLSCTVKKWAYIGLAVAGLYLGIRGLEAWTKFRG